MRRLLAAAAVIIALAGCGSPIKSGYVTDKIYERPWNETVYDRICWRYDKSGFCDQYTNVPRTVHHAATWRLDIEEGDQEGWVYVDEMTFSRYEIGSHYPDAR